MYKAITLIEMLTAIAIMVIAIYFISPIIFTFQDRISLNSEIENINLLFIKSKQKLAIVKETIP